jgi:hypothetical protein
VIRKGDAYRLLYPRWRPAPAEREPGYSLLLLIPGDLPVFLRIAMEVCRAQDPGHRVETLVLPDIATRGFHRAFARHRAEWTGGPIRVVPLRPLEGALARWRKNPHLNCWLQFVTGVNHARATHAIWHDADLFLGEPDFLRRHHEECRDRGLAVLGLSEAWDDWYRRHGLGHMVSTWEMALDVEWARGFRPWEHRGHDGAVDGQPVTFDISFSPQSRTEPERIALTSSPPPFVHFNHTMGRYRQFQRSRRRGRPWEDATFRVLLVRLLVDAFDDSDHPYDAPTVAELLRGLRDPAAPVTYRAPETLERYAAFRRQLDELSASLVGARRAEALSRAVAPFDAALGRG